MTQCFTGWGQYDSLQTLRLERENGGTVMREVVMASGARGHVLLRRVHHTAGQWLPWERRGLGIQHVVASRFPGLAPRLLWDRDAGEYYCAAVEWIDAQDLNAWNSAIQPSLAQLAAVGCRICRAIESWESAGCSHNDLKGEHFLIRPDHTLCVVDWGSASQLGEGRGVPCTPLYTPEEGPGTTGDSWAASVLLFELMAGYRPRPERQPGVIDFAAPVLFPPHFPPGLRALFAKALARHPGDRFKNAAELRAALEAVFGFGASATRPAQPPPRFRLPERLTRRAVAIAAICLAVTIAGYVLGILAGRRALAAEPDVRQRNPPKKKTVRKPRKKRTRSLPATRG